MYKVKKYKITYLDPRNPSVVYSKMYESENDALFGIQDVPDGMDFLILKLKNYKENEQSSFLDYSYKYTWEILPYGYHNKFKTAIWIYERKFLLLLFLLIIYLITKK